MGPANKHCVGFALDDPLFDFVLSIGSTTHRDRHGERISEGSIKDFVKKVKGTYQPFLFNHEGIKKPIGAVISAKSFRMPDGELAAAMLTVFYTRNNSWLKFPAGQNNTEFDNYLGYIDIDLLVKKHDELIDNVADDPMPIATAMDAYLGSHIVHDDGHFEVRKYNFATAGDFRIILHSGDHPPPHFHVISKQRNINARFNIETLELDSIVKGTVRGKDIKVIQMFFAANPEQHQKLLTKAKELKVGIRELTVTE